jgi:hypothetical protein
MQLERLKVGRALSTILPPPGATLALAPGMTNPARKLSLVSNDDRREIPTEPHNLKPSEVPAPDVGIPRLRPPPAELTAAIRALPPPNPDSYMEMSIALVLRGIESQKDLHDMIDGAVDRINWDADARARQIKADFDLTNGQMQSLATSVAQLESTVTRELLPRTKASEDGLRELRLELASIKEQVAKIPELERRIAELSRPQ